MRPENNLAETLETADRPQVMTIRMAIPREVEEELGRLRRENADLNRFRNGVLWITAIIAPIFSVMMMARAVMPGHGWELIPAILLLGYDWLFVRANGDIG